MTKNKRKAILKQRIKDGWIKILTGLLPSTNLSQALTATRSMIVSTHPISTDKPASRLS